MKLQAENVSDFIEGNIDFTCPKCKYYFTLNLSLFSSKECACGYVWKFNYSIEAETFENDIGEEI